MSPEPQPITGFSICNSIGSNRHEVRQALFEGRAGLGPSPIELPFDAVVGAVHEEVAYVVSTLTPRLARASMLGVRV